MPAKLDENQDAFAIRIIRDYEANACIEAIINTKIGLAHECPEAIDAAIAAIRARIADRVKG